MRRAGFTLLEISIVLVIVGFIIGGVLVGRDMIRSAQVRGTIRQVEMFNIAVRTFRLKYNALPGDMLPQQAASFGFLQLTGGIMCGNGNGVLEAPGADTPCSGPLNWGSGADARGEVLAFWRHLSDARLLDNTYGADLTADGYPGTLPVSSSAIHSYLPKPKIGGGTSFFAFASLQRTNWFGLMNIDSIITASGWYQFLPATSDYLPVVSPLVAYSMDVKIDNGLPNTGIVRAMAPDTMPGGLTGGTGRPDGFYWPYYSAVDGYPTPCTQGTGIVTDTYNLSVNNGGNDPCGMAFKFQ